MCVRKIYEQSKKVKCFFRGVYSRNIRKTDGNIWHLDEVGDYAVGGTALYKVPLGGEKLLRVESAKLLQEILQ